MTDPATVYRKVSRTWEYRCPVPDCRYTLTTPRESEARANAEFHAERHKP